MQRDPLGYVDGMSHYAGYHIMHGGIDPFGLNANARSPGKWYWVPSKGHKDGKTYNPFWAPDLEQNKGIISHWSGEISITLPEVKVSSSSSTITANGDATSDYYTSPLFGLPIGSLSAHAEESGSVTIKCDPDTGAVSVSSLQGEAETDRIVHATTKITAEVAGDAHSILVTVQARTGYSEKAVTRRNWGWQFGVSGSGVAGSVVGGSSVEIDKSFGKSYTIAKGIRYECECQD
jgi:hypothetical protein